MELRRGKVIKRKEKREWPLAGSRFWVRRFVLLDGPCCHRQFKYVRRASSALNIYLATIPSMYLGKGVFKNLPRKRRKQPKRTSSREVPPLYRIIEGKCQSLKKSVIKRDGKDPTRTARITSPKENGHSACMPSPSEILPKRTSKS